MAVNATLREEDLVAVGSRVSWGAIFAGGVITLAVYLVLTLLGAAIGLTVASNVGPQNLKTGAAIWAILATAVALFVGGWVTTQCTVGENRTEAVMHGVILWGLVFATLLGLMATGIRAGLNAMVGMTNVGQAARGTTGEDWEAAARRAGVPEETITQGRRQAAEAGRATDDPADQRATAAATRAAWWSLLGTVLSMAAAVAGAVAGAGTTFRLLTAGLPLRRTAYDGRQTAVRP